NGRKIDLIGSHGQTISHKDKHVSIQAGDPQYLYSEFNVPIVYDFRQADIDVGGNGAPLMPFLDWLLFRNLGSHTITLNVGGIANLTFIPKKSKKENVTGFDTGPGMALIDECCREYYNRSMDKDGKFGRKGKVDSKLLDVLMKHPFITKIPPKSTGRDEFSEEMVKSIREKYPQISTNDFIRTLAAFSAKSISYNVEKYANFNTNKSKLIVSGGGVYHPIFMEDLKNFCSALKIHSSQEIGIDPNMKESLLIAVLAVAKFKGIASNMRPVTGALRDVPLGKIYKEIE
ncbi:MAG: anhydro-N-acetylmuramic acid kinase, partial [Fidelibacterota bacterium]